MRYLRLFITLGLVGLTGFGCASLRMADRASNQLFRDGRYDEAALRLTEDLNKYGEDSKDYLLYLMDIGLAHHSAGNYALSNEFLLKADRIADISDYTSLSSEAAAFFSSDNVGKYKGEDFEKVLINTYLAMNYALLGDFESARVEARKVNRKLELMVTEGKKNYKQNAFARYLSAILYEADGNWNDAYVDYRKTYSIKSDFSFLGRDLWRLAKRLGFTDDLSRWDQEYHLTAEDHRLPRNLNPNEKLGEIIVLYENGISPVKQPNPSFRDLPQFFPRINPVSVAEVSVDGESRGRTEILEDIESTAIANLNENYSKLVAKKIAGDLVKTGIAYEVGRQTKQPIFAAATQLVFRALERADLRSWFLLPRDLQMLRVSVKPGSHQVSLLPLGASVLPEKIVQVKPGQKVFVNFRYTPPA